MTHPPAQAAHHAPSHPTHAPVAGQGYTYRLHPLPPRRPPGLLCLALWSTTIAPVLAVIGIITALLWPGADAEIVLAATSLAHAVACTVAIGARS